MKTDAIVMCYSSVFFSELIQQHFQRLSSMLLWLLVAATKLLFNVASISCVVFWYELLIDVSLTAPGIKISSH